MIDPKAVDKLCSALAWYMRRQAPCLQVHGQGLRPSRTRYGQFTSESEIQAYRAILCYLQKGLGGYEDVIGRIMYTITSVQQGSGRWGYFFHLFSFGWDDNALHHLGKAFPTAGIHGKVIAKILCELAGTDRGLSPPVVHSLFPYPVDMYNLNANVNNEDLLVFFCSDRSVTLGAAARRIYSGQIKRNSVWVFLNEESVDFEIGKFIPEFP